MKKFGEIRVGKEKMAPHMDENTNLPLTLHRWYRDAMRTVNFSDVSDKIIERLEYSKSHDETQLLRDMLIQEYRRVCKYDRALNLLKIRANEESDSVVAACSLASFLLDEFDHPVEAITAVDEAIRRAKKTNTFSRLALGIKARIALKLDRYDLLEEVLWELLNIQNNHVEADIGIERDFFDRADCTRLSQAVVLRFSEYLSI